MSYRIARCYIIIAIGFAAVLLAALMLIFEKRFTRLNTFIKKHEKLLVGLALGGGLLYYLIAIMGYMGVEKFVKDFDVFLMWSKALLDDGLKGFMSEYPPFGLYILALLQAILRIFGLGDHYLAASLLMKMPAILSTLAIAYLAYVWAKKSYSDAKPWLIMVIIAFNPAFIINASMWGQMDMVMILAAVLSFYYLKQQKAVPALLLYTVGCLIKPQMIFLAPVFGMFLILPVFEKRERRDAIKNIIIGAALSVVLFFVAALPFKERFTDIWLIDFFGHITSEHPVNTASAFNLFGLAGGSFKPYTDGFLFLNYQIWGYIFIALICIIVAVMCAKNKNRRDTFMLGAFCMAAVFTLGVSMHERYILPAIAFMAISLVFYKDKRSVIFTLLYTLLAVINQSIILFDLFGGKEWTFRLCSGISVAIFILFAFYIVLKIFKNNEKVELNEGNT